MEKIDCCSKWDFCCVEGKCCNPDMGNNYACTTAKNLSAGVNYLKQGELLLVDGNSFLHRCYHAFPFMTSPAGIPTNAVYGILKMLEGLVKELNPTHLAVCFDASRHTWRHKLYPQYKANRKPAPEELVRQFTLIRQVLSALRILYVEHPKFEADDLLGAIAHKATGFLTRIATSDRDCVQLISPRVRLMLYNHGGHTEMDLQAARERYGFEPWQMVHFKALAGDSSDNIPGVPGVGEKTATELIKRHGTIGEIEKAGAAIPGRTGKLLADGKDMMKLSYRLARINSDSLIEVDFNALEMEVDTENGAKMLASLGIKKIDLSVFARREKPVETITEKQAVKNDRQPTNSKVIQLTLF